METNTVSIEQSNLSSDLTVVPSPKKRIEYIDLMKGVCITLVVFHHAVGFFGVEIIDKVLHNFRMPLYFFLAGMFFKRYSCFMEFLIRKTNRILIPFLFFSWIPYCALSFLYTDNFTNPLFWLLAPIKTYNGVLWFLKSFFIAQVFYYLFDTVTRNKSVWIKIIILLIVTLITYYLSGYYNKFHSSDQPSIIERPFFTSIMMQPYLYVAHLVNSHHLLQQEWSKRQTISCIVLALTCSFLFAQPNVVINKAQYGDNYILAYISAISSICVVIIISKNIKRLPFFSYLGRYSLIVLGTHFAYLTVLKRLCDFSDFVNFVILMVLMPPTIWFFKKFFPYFTAQKDLIKYKSREASQS